MNLFIVTILCLVISDKSYGLRWPCLSESDCPTEGAICSIQTASCQCEYFENVFSDDNTKCLASSLIGEQCTDSAQCNLMPTGASCNSGICACTDERKYVHGQCRAVSSLDESCQSDLDCDFGYDRESVKCQNNICDCANGYYRRNGNICRKKSMEINDACVVNEDCQDLGNDVVCKTYKCQKTVDGSNSDSTLTINIVPDNLSNASHSKRDQYTQSQIDDDNNIHTKKTQTSREIAIQTSIEHLPSKSNIFKNTASIKNLTNYSQKSSFSSRHKYFKSAQYDIKTLSSSTYTDEDVEAKLTYGSSCDNIGHPCAGLAHSICSNSLCLCGKGYYRKNAKCFAELGEIAESATECEHYFDTTTKKCLCQPNYFYDPTLRQCRKPITFKLSCTGDNQCSPYGAATCPSEIPRRCTCAQYAEYDEMRQLCVFKSGLGAQCQSDEACPIENSICYNDTCVCNTNYMTNNGKCDAGLDAVCSTDSQCQVENSVCESTSNNNNSTAVSNKTCQCRKGFVHFNNNCLKEVEEIEDPCIENEQCAPLLAKCLNNKCSCGGNSQFRNDRCQPKKSLDEICTRESECYVKNDLELVECRNSVCKCKLGYAADTTKTSCVRVATSKNSSGRPSVLKIITFALIGSAFLITTAALKQAYY